MLGIERREFSKNYRKSALNNSFAMNPGFSKSSLFIKREDLPAYLNLFNPMNIVQKATNYFATFDATKMHQRGSISSNIFSVL
jgi:hypothetical protein